MQSVEVLPFDSAIGYPQRQAVQINNVAYTVYYRWNPEDDGFAVLKIVGNVGGAVVLNSRIEDITPLAARDPVTYIDLFQLLPSEVTASKCVIWIFYD